eukprot:TRINITY_DN1787_c0_g1_i2.p1 TRINITY_DN1787_c0_g1~~TRINITY_DN1787_c0_g1_i2.p1  ORF type:complete len:223 (-),score=62.71 TRINITY_DN1787_c0_g1_i2:5-673(-)
MAAKFRKILAVVSNQTESNVQVQHFLFGANFKLERARDLINRLDETEVKACSGIQRELVTGASLTDLINNFFDQKVLTYVNCLPLLRALRGCSGIDMTGGMGSCPRFGEWYDRWGSWVQDHPAARKYMDPDYLIFQPTGLAAFPAAAIMGSFPQLPSNTPIATVHPPGGTFQGLYQVGTADEARMTAVAVRVTHANPGGGAGGAGPAHYVGSFNSANPIVWW